MQSLKKIHVWAQMKVLLCTKYFGHMTKMAATPILLLKNQKTNDLGTWYVALGMWGLPSLFK